MKIPNTPPHTKKILLQNALFDTEPDICFIVRDNKMKKDEVDETVMKFQEMLQANGVTNVKTIMPLTKLKKDYGPNNMKIKLLNTYDVFLVESEVAEHTYTILGKVKSSRTWNVMKLIKYLFSISSRNESDHIRLTPPRKKP